MLLSWLGRSAWQFVGANWFSSRWSTVHTPPATWCLTSFNTLSHSRPSSCLPLELFSLQSSFVFGSSSPPNIENSSVIGLSWPHFAVWAPSTADPLNYQGCSRIDWAAPGRLGEAAGFVGIGWRLNFCSWDPLMPATELAKKVETSAGSSY